jgi:nucleoside-triphosphatase THEP1
MKSISPSAFIIGPMIGIFTEAILLEFFIFLLGKNLVGYTIGGASAVLSTIFHKIISLLILYGFNFIKILSDLYLFAVKQIHLEKLSPLILVSVIITIYIITGITGALAGYIAGRSYPGTKGRSDEQSEITLNQKNQLFSQTSKQPYSVPLLFLNLVSVIAILFLMNSGLNAAAALFSILYAGFCIFKYKNSLKRLKKPSFWISFVIITFAATFLWNGFSDGVFLSIEGLMIGVKMNARALIIILGFAAISVELKNPVIKSVLYHGGFASLYQSLSLAFSALPFFISTLSKNKNKRGIPHISIKGLFSQAELLFGIFEKEHLLRPDIVIITGEIHQGKSSFAKVITDWILEQKIRVGGFLSPGINENGKRTGFNLLDLESSEQTELCSDKKDDNRIRFGQYYFNGETISRGLEILSLNNVSDKQLIVIDEIGPLELNGGGWNDAIEKLTGSSTTPQLWVVRKSIVRKINRKWNVGNIYIFDITENSTQEVIGKIYELIR